ncbi:hypothetical protein F511_17956 [Dorcoceras hygrometricum]|uniref:CCHC-type domain-containing protein n=1 Tax=Dorcoceras hygrometricum TaxID=472368 RepID=A0A2Z7CEB7_9LAMI|nr:hypothetical protein F511_17956 [Dorcoceras hygrometricum]
MRRTQSPYFSNKSHKIEQTTTDLNCYNCGRSCHFIADCTKPQKDDKKSSDKRRSRPDKKIFRKRRDQKSTVAKESNSNWAGSDSDESTSSSSSSDSEKEEVRCLMIDENDEVFDFSNTEFTREDLVSALNEMVHEYKWLTHTFEDVKAENKCLKDKSDDPSCSQLDDSDSLKTELSKLKTENESLRIKSNELASEKDRLNQVMSSWTKSSVLLGKLHDVLNPFIDKTVLGFSTGESSSGLASNMYAVVEAALHSVQTDCVQADEDCVQADADHVQADTSQAQADIGFLGYSDGRGGESAGDMPPRRRGRARRQIPIESEAQNDEGERSIPIRRRGRQVDDEVDILAARIDEIELIMARFQRMNSQTFNGDESSSDAESWLQHITGLFDRVRYDDEHRLSLATFQLRKNAER